MPEDTLLLNKYLKQLDPNSVVREGEMGLDPNSALREGEYQGQNFSFEKLLEIFKQAHQRKLYQQAMQTQQQGIGTGFQGPGGGFGPAMDPRVIPMMQQMKQMDPGSVLREGEIAPQMQPQMVNPQIQQMMQGLPQPQQQDWMRQGMDPFLNNSFMPQGWIPNR